MTVLGKMGPPSTGVQESRREFVCRVWDKVVPQTQIEGHHLIPWVPECVRGPLGRYISRKDLQKIDLSNADICTLCFASIHRSLSRNWASLAPEFAVSVEGWLDELNLWDGFDRSKMRLSDGQRDVIKVRFDIADVMFASKKESLDRDLQSFGININKMDQEKVIRAVQELVIMRAHIDLAVIMLQNVSRSTSVLDRVASRLRREREHYYFFLRDLLVKSTWWKAPDGATFIGGDEVPRHYTNEMNSAVAPRLVDFENHLQKLEDSLEQEIPPKDIVYECSELIRRSVMPSQTTNIHLTNSQVGVLNTGTIRDVQSIDATITTLNARGDIDVGEAFKKITEGVAGDDTLREPEKAELLSNVKFLSEMAAKSDAERNSSVVKSVLHSVSEGLSAAGPAVKSLLPLIPVLTKFFGL